jgi:lactoylglutathione lyase
LQLAKNHLDIGLYTNLRQEQLDFWQQEAGLEFDHLGKLGGGMHQLRHHMNGSIMKLNHAREPLPEVAPSGFRELIIAREGLSEERRLQDPDGNKVRLVPPGTDGVTGIGIAIAVSDIAAAHRFLVQAMEFDDIDAATVRCGDTLLFLEEGGAPQPPGQDWRGLGYRYITVQIFKCEEDHAGILARGGSEGSPPRVLGDTVRFSFVRDPDGNPIEVSQRGTLTGSID